MLILWVQTYIHIDRLKYRLIDIEIGREIQING